MWLAALASLARAEASTAARSGSGSDSYRQQAGRQTDAQAGPADRQTGRKTHDRPGNRQAATGKRQQAGRQTGVRIVLDVVHALLCLGLCVFL